MVSIELDAILSMKLAPGIDCIKEDFYLWAKGVAEVAGRFVGVPESEFQDSVNSLLVFGVEHLLDRFDASVGRGGFTFFFTSFKREALRGMSERRGGVAYTLGDSADSAVVTPSVEDGYVLEDVIFQVEPDLCQEMFMMLYVGFPVDEVKALCQERTGKLDAFSHMLRQARLVFADAVVLNNEEVLKGIKAKYSGTSFDEFMEVVGVDLAIKVMKVLGGSHIHIPRVCDALRDLRDEKIYEQLRRGGDTRTVAARYGITPGRARQVFKTVSERKGAGAT